MDEFAVDAIVVAMDVVVAEAVVVVVEIAIVVVVEAVVGVVVALVVVVEVVAAVAVAFDSSRPRYSRHISSVSSEASGQSWCESHIQPGLMQVTLSAHLKKAESAQCCIWHLSSSDLSRQSGVPSQRCLVETHCVWSRQVNSLSKHGGALWCGGR